MPKDELEAGLLQFTRAVVLLRSKGAWATALDIQKEINRVEAVLASVGYPRRAPINVSWLSVAKLCGRYLSPVAASLEGYYDLAEIRR
jgi:hypothetical protein